MAMKFVRVMCGRKEESQELAHQNLGHSLIQLHVGLGFYQFFAVLGLLSWEHLGSHHWHLQ